MPGERLKRILAELAVTGDEAWSSIRLCEATRDIVGVSGAGVMIMSADVPQGSLCTTNDVSNLIEELQFTLGEGPCVDAYRENRVVLAPDLAQPGTTPWLAFTPPAVEAGVRAVFAFPLRVGGIRLGALDLYRDGPGPLSDIEHAVAMVMAEVMARWILDTQAAAPPGAIAAELEESLDLHAVVHNAAGALSVQLGVSIGEALIRLRAYAYANNRLIGAVAEDIVARRLRF